MPPASIRPLLVAVCAAALVSIAGCGGGEDPAAPAPGGAPVVEDPGAIHVHGLGVNPRDGALFIATHTGLFRLPRGSESAERVAGRYQDTMGFTVTGPDRFLGSGHPDRREDLPPLLGLIRSDDAGATWTPVSLLGEADFHSLEAVGDRVYGFDATRSRLLASADGGRSWDERTAPGPAIELAVDPGRPSTLVAATERGLARSDDGGRRWQPAGGPGPGLLAWPGRTALFHAGPSGRVSVSGDGGRSWRSRGRLPAEPAALAADRAATLYAALHDGTVLASADGGRRWRVRARPRAR